MADILQSKMLTAFLVFILTLLSITYCFQISTGTVNTYARDYGKFYQAARFAIQHKNIYAPIFVVRKPITTNNTLTNAVPEKKKLSPLLNPPFFALLIKPLAYLSY